MRLTYVFLCDTMHIFQMQEYVLNKKNVLSLLSHNNVIDVIREITPCRIKTCAMTLTLTLTMTSGMTFRLKDYEVEKRLASSNLMYYRLYYLIL